MSDSAAYLEPYRAAARRHGAGFASLLWASPHTQAARFHAMERLVAFEDRRVLDVGCGRADFLDFLVARGIWPSSYVGIEGVAELAAAARAKSRQGVTIIEADFVADPRQMLVGADVVAISGALNTMHATAFYATLRRAFDAASQALVFNFLSSERLAGASYLAWHPPAEVLRFAQTLSDRVLVLEDYLPGDCTVAVGRKDR